MQRRHFKHQSINTEQRSAIFSILHLQAFLFLQGLIQTKFIILTGIDERMKGAHDCLEIEQKQTNTFFTSDYCTITLMYCCSDKEA